MRRARLRVVRTYQKEDGFGSEAEVRPRSVMVWMAIGTRLRRPGARQLPAGRRRAISGTMLSRASGLAHIRRDCISVGRAGTDRTFSGNSRLPIPDEEILLRDSEPG